MVLGTSSEECYGLGEKMSDECCVIQPQATKRRPPRSKLGWKLYFLKKRIVCRYWSFRSRLDGAILWAIIFSFKAVPVKWRNKVRNELDDRWSSTRVPLEIWGDVIMKGKAYQSMKVHGDTRFDGFTGTPGGWMNIDGSVYAGPLAESGYGYGSTGLFNSEPCKLEMHGTEETIEVDE